MSAGIHASPVNHAVKNKCKKIHLKDIMTIP